jgi:transposase
MGANITNFIGIDISKSQIDIALIKNNDKTEIIPAVFENNANGMKVLTKFLEETHKLDLTQSIFCMEYTGIYNRCILEYLTEKQCLIWLEMPVQIIKSMGLQRGKSDSIDAKKIANYAYMHREDAKIWHPRRAVVNEIHELLSLRERLITSRNMLQVPIDEMKSIGDKKTAALLQSNCKLSLSAIAKNLENINKKLNDIVNSDENIKKLYELSTSVPGIGMITALAAICYTNEHKSYNQGKQLACYVGVAPFEHSSGSSVKGRNRISHMANKPLKKLLHLGAMAAIKSNGELKAYYVRKVSEGKNKMSVLNAIRNKMILRLTAVIKRGTPYQQQYCGVNC